MVRAYGDTPSAQRRVGPTVSDRRRVRQAQFAGLQVDMPPS